MPTPLAIQFALCPLVLVCLLFTSAPYGRHYRPGWGPRLSNRLAWVLMELPALTFIAALVLTAPGAHRPVALVPLALWVLHYAYRTFLFPALMRSSGRRFPVLLVLFAVAFNLLNGYNNADALVADALAGAPFPSPHFAVGVIVFAAGFAIHAHADTVIRRLRRPGEAGYGIPQGGLFHWVGSPQYLGEIIQWAGWAILTWSLAGLAFALFTFCNLAPRALANHRWYRQRFPAYPPERRALIPGLL